MKLRSARKNYVFDLNPGTVFEILKYINPFLHFLVSRHYFDDEIDIDYDKRLPISLLLSLHNVEVLENFKAVLLSLKFREKLEEQIEMYGDYSTMMWFQDHDIIMSESALVAVARRGDLGLLGNLSSSNPRSRRCIEVGSSKRIPVGCQKSFAALFNCDKEFQIASLSLDELLRPYIYYGYVFP